EDRLAGIIEQEDVSRAARQTREELAALGQFHRDLVNALPAPVIATTVDGAVSCWNAAAARLWRRTESEVVGKRLTALGLPGLPGDLLLEKTAQVRDGKVERREGEATLEVDGAETVLSTEVMRLHDAASELVGLLYVVTDVTTVRGLDAELRQTRDERQKAIEDLQTTNEELQSSNEELETTNEELQSANEELQTTNEELQSTNEELETTNEELQSTNSELDATNRELAHRTDELNVMSFYQRTIIRSLSAAVVVIDPGGRITLWNLASERLFGITENEALGQTLWTLRIPVIGRKVISAIRRALGRKVGHRIDDISYDRAGGGRGHAALAAVPLVDEDRFLGGVVIVEDTTRAVLLAEERLRDGVERRDVRTRRRAEPSSA
ncbi:MAG TPA: PAS domain-containing protein, partial [Anaeromyxobacteraceae bacterium]|nr:PAS domain-containing protein [Anaeromyxobacteraceae bacterium]